jgi:hypothetical protein
MSCPNPSAAGGPGTLANDAALRSLAQELVWWQTPEQALADCPRFLAQVMTLGHWDDVQTVRAAFGDEAFRQVLACPPPGVFDERSWAYWHWVFKQLPVPPLPSRRL